VNGRRTYAFAEDVGTLTVPGEKNVNADCNKHAASTLADGSPGVHQVCDVPMQHEYLWCGGARVRHSTSHCDYLRMKIVAVPSHVYSTQGELKIICMTRRHGICPLFCPCFAHCLCGAIDINIIPLFPRSPSYVHHLHPPCPPTTKAASLTQSRPAGPILRYLSRNSQYTSL
jgi:hypothetical protein